MFFFKLSDINFNEMLCVLKIILGEEVVRSTQLDKNLANELVEIGESMRNLGVPGIEKVLSGRTLCTHDFYEGTKELFFY